MSAPFVEHHYFVTCAQGLEPLLADELRAMRTHGVRPQRGGVLCRGTIKDAYRICLWSRLASRVLLSLGDINAANADELYEGIKAIAWEDHIRAQGSFLVQSTGTNDELRNTQFTNMRVKDAVADRFLERFDRRPNIDTEVPDVAINVLLRGEKAKVSIDLAGDPLHRRGYRQDGLQVTAPMKETLAAAMLMTAEWPRIAKEGGALVDFMCGSGTLLLEGAMMAGDIAPGLLRKRWGFLHWVQHDEEAWDALVDEAQNRRTRGLAALPPISGSDHDARAIDIARRCVRRARLDGAISLARLDMRAATAPVESKPGLVALNPPYGQRLASTDEVCEIYKDIAEVTRLRFMDWELAIITPDLRLSNCLELKPHTEKELYNGRILSPVRVYKVGAAQEVEAPTFDDHFGQNKQHPQAFGGKGERIIAPKFEIDTEALENRLTKMFKHYEKWARKTGVTCYRVYDADLPDFNCAIDLYQGAGPSADRTWVRIAEYMAPDEIDPRLASARMEALKDVCVRLFEVPDHDVILKQRKRQRGKQQYFADVKEGPIVGIVEEGNLLFEVNMNQYLDTGIFLDHRDVRTYIYERVAEKSFLNLFAYTGVVSVFAANGGAKSTTTVDMSKTYLDIARRNMERNELTSEHDIFIQKDVLTWVDEALEQGLTYDVIFCDPPTFSNSKRMDDTWDVERDHVALIQKLAGLMAPGGELIFSCNKRGFALDNEALAQRGFTIKDITKMTMPRDFEKNARIHCCFNLTRKETADDQAV